MCEVRYLLSTGEFAIHEAVSLRPRSDPRCRFGLSLISRKTTTLAHLPLRSLSQIHICLPCSLPSRHPDCGFQEGASLALFSPSARAGFRTLSRPLFIQAGRLTRWNGWSPSLHLLSPEGDSSNCDIVSQERLGNQPRGTGWAPGAARCPPCASSAALPCSAAHRRGATAS